MRIAIPQLNFQSGNIKINTEKIINSVKKAQYEKADLIIFPELAICGAMPQDLLEQENFVNDCRLAVEKIAGHCQHIAAIVGAPNLDPENGIMYNSAYFIQNGEVVDGVHKTILSDYDIFEDSRYFVAGEENTPIRYKNQNIRILFDEYEGEDIDKQDNLIIYIGLSPFTSESLGYRKEAWGNLARKHGKPILSVNHIGGNTSILFDGNSMVFNTKGDLVACLGDFKEDYAIIDTAKINAMPALKKDTPNEIARIRQALVVGISDYFRKNGFTKAVLGLSGGIDSAIVAVLTAEAIGKENILGLLMPSRFSTDHSVEDAKDLAQKLGISYEIIPIKEIYEQYINTLKAQFKELPFNIAEENLQARIRGSLIMAMSNKFGHIPLNTSNKSEAAVGYGTLYGDMCGSLAVIGDVYKTDIYRLARYINANGEIIPENTISKAPSAELRPDQKDQDYLPEYKELDSILKLYIEENESAETIIAKGFPKDTVEKITGLVKRNEYKRAQCPPILKVSKKAFGKGRQFPY